MITRRGLLQGILAAGIAPAVGHAGIIMPPRHVIVPSWWEKDLLIEWINDGWADIQRNAAGLPLTYWTGPDSWSMSAVDWHKLARCQQALNKQFRQILDTAMKGHA